MVPRVYRLALTTPPGIRWAAITTTEPRGKETAAVVPMVTMEYAVRTRQAVSLVVSLCPPGATLTTPTAGG